MCIDRETTIILALLYFFFLVTVHNNQVPLEIKKRNGKSLIVRSYSNMYNIQMLYKLFFRIKNTY